jgi:hypothetical protein
LSSSGLMFTLTGMTSTGRWQVSFYGSCHPAVAGVGAVLVPCS